MSLIINLLVGTIAVLITTYILPGVSVDSITTAIVVAIVLGVVNTFIKPMLTILTLPLTLVTFGIFALILNALLVYGVAYIVPGFEIEGFLWALIFSVVISLVGAFLNALT